MCLAEFVADLHHGTGQGLEQKEIRSSQACLFNARIADEPQQWFTAKSQVC